MNLITKFSLIIKTGVVIIASCPLRFILKTICTFLSSQFQQEWTRYLDYEQDIYMDQLNAKKNLWASHDGALMRPLVLTLCAARDIGSR